jgi:hypothetical protein
MSDRFLERRIIITFCVKLEKNASYTYALPSEAYEGEAVEKSSVSGWRKLFQECPENVKDDEDNDHNFLPHQGYCSL